MSDRHLERGGDNGCREKRTIFDTIFRFVDSKIPHLKSLIILPKLVLVPELYIRFRK